MLAMSPSQAIWRLGSSPFRFRSNESAASSESLAGQPREHDPGQSSAPPAEVIEIRERNESLQDLSRLFPDVQLEVFREMLSTFSPESRLHVVTEALLKDKSRFVRGRWRASPQTNGEAPAPESPPDIIPMHESFRSQGYKNAVKKAFYEEFSSLSHSTIKTVLMERNHSYTESRVILLDINSRSWRSTVSRLFTRRKTQDPSGHPLLSWDKSNTGTPKPKLRYVASAELAEELEKTLIAPLRSTQLNQQICHDNRVAVIVNYEQAQLTGSLFECECCYDSVTFESILTCSNGDHFLCFTCVQRTLHEALFGQGFAQSTDLNKGTLRCFAVAGGTTGQCSGHLPQPELRRAIESEIGGAEIWKRFEDKLAEDNLRESCVATLKCPHCPYAEAESSPSSSKQEHRHRKPVSDLVLFLLWLWSAYLGFCNGPIGNTAAVISIAVFTQLIHRGFPKHSKVLESQKRIATEPLPSQGRKFICRNPDCKKVCCLRCSVVWQDVHQCYLSSKESLRTYIETAISDAVKRTCPLCGLSFVKASGCNKLICPCGYKMCYLCRADVRVLGYQHFCPHFRPDGGPCTACTKCDLYKTENDEEVIRQAREIAEKEWLEHEGKELDRDRLMEKRKI